MIVRCIAIIIQMFLRFGIPNSHLVAGHHLPFFEYIIILQKVLEILLRKEIIMNWYDQYKVAEREDMLLKQAGWSFKDILPLGLAGAVILVFLGSGIQNAAKKMNMEEEEVVQALNSPAVVEEAREIMQSKKTLDQAAEQISERVETEEPEEAELTKRQEWLKNVIARTIYAEGSGESMEGKNAIASVIYTRGGGDAEGMVRNIQIPMQYSCWNRADDDDWTNMKKGKGSAWEASESIADQIVRGNFTPTVEADHYFNPDKARPSWGYVDKGRTQLRPHVRVDNHVFMELGSWVGKGR